MSLKVGRDDLRTAVLCVGVSTKRVQPRKLTPSNGSGRVVKRRLPLTTIVVNTSTGSRSAMRTVRRKANFDMFFVKKALKFADEV